MMEGVEAALAMESIRGGFASSIPLDASGSTNLDNPQQKPMFRWTCRTIDGEGCFVYSSSSPVRFENYVAEEKLMSPIFTVPASTLAPSMYYMTVSVSQGLNNDSASMSVEIVLDDLPEVRIEKNSNLVNPEEKIVLNGFVTSNSDVDVGWESVDEVGFEFAPVYFKLSLQGAQKNRLFPLVIPASSSMEGEGLKIGASYKFRLFATYDGQEMSYAEAIFTTKSPPTPGKIEVTPSSGDALVTKFLFSTSGWSDVDADFPFKASFGFKSSQTNSDVIWLGTAFDEDLSVEAFLPAVNSPTKYIPLVKVCDSDNSCSYLEGSEITVNLPTELPPSTLIDMSKALEGKLEGNENVAEALGEFEGMLLTLQAMGANGQLKVLQEIVEFQISGKADALQSELLTNPAASGACLELLDGTNSIGENLDLNPTTLEKINALLVTLFSSVTGAPLKEDLLVFAPSERLRRLPSDGNIFYPKTDDDLLAARSGKRIAKRSIDDVKNSVGHQRKYKRTASTISTEAAVNLSLDNIKTMIRTSELLITSASSEGKVEKLNELVSQIPGYLTSLCKSMSLGDQPNSVYGRLVSFSVRKPLMISSEAETDFVVSSAEKDDSDFIMGNSSVLWGSVLSSYDSWDCDKGNQSSCSGACLSTVEYGENFTSPAMPTSSPGKPRGHMIRMALMNPENGKEFDWEAEKDEPIAISFWMKTTETSEGSKLKCFGWDEDDAKWTSKSCWNSYNSSRDETTYHTCHCNYTKYAAVFEVRISSNTTNEVTARPTTTSSTTILPTRSLLKTKDFTIRLNGNYNESVEGREDEFILKFREEMAQQLNLTIGHIRNVRVKPGSIVVEFQLVEFEGQRNGPGVGSLESAAAFLNEMLMSENPNLVVQDLDGRELYMLPNESPSTAPDPSNISILIGAIVGGVLFIAFIFIVLGIYLKNKKRQDKVSPIYGNQPPTYKAIHFEKSLDGTAALIAKNRSMGAVEANRNWKPDSAAYTNDGEDALYIERNSAGTRSSGADSGIGNDDEVPDAFDYRPPSQKELENSGPIPEHILEKIHESSRNILVGKPDEPITVKQKKRFKKLET